MLLVVAHGENVLLQGYAQTGASPGDQAIITQGYESGQPVEPSGNGENIILQGYLQTDATTEDQRIVTQGYDSGQAVDPYVDSQTEIQVTNPRRLVVSTNL